MLSLPFIGTEFHYTNHGYTLLAAVLEEATGKRFSRLVREIFADLGMKQSGLDRKNKITYNRTR